MAPFDGKSCSWNDKSEIRVKLKLVGHMKGSRSPGLLGISVYNQKGCLTRTKKKAEVLLVNRA